MNTEVLALIRNSLAEVPMWDWLEPGARLRIITQRSALDTAVPAHVEVSCVGDYDHSPQVELAALDTHARRRVGRIVTVSEWDVLRGARLREQLDLPGQHYRSANAFRDKVLMKQHWAQHGVPAAAYTAIEAPCDLLAFAEHTGGPIVVKPRRAAGSRGVAVLRTPAEARTWLERHWDVPAGHPSPWMAEAFIHGRLNQVDGHYQHGELELAWPTAIGDLLQRQKGTATPVHAAMLDPDDPTTDAATDLVRRALDTLPAPGSCAIHAELWRTETGLLMNEIGARVGGAGTARMIQAATGINLHRHTLRAALYGERAEHRTLAALLTSAGFAMLPRRPGRVNRIDALPPGLRQPWLTYASIRVAPGETSPAAHNSVDAAAHFVVTGAHREQVAERLTQATDWARRAIVYAHDRTAPSRRRAR